MRLLNTEQWIFATAFLVSVLFIYTSSPNAFYYNPKRPDEAARVPLSTQDPDDSKKKNLHLIAFTESGDTNVVSQVTITNNVLVENTAPKASGHHDPHMTTESTWAGYYPNATE